MAASKVVIKGEHWVDHWVELMVELWAVSSVAYLVDDWASTRVDLTVER